MVATVRLDEALKEKLDVLSATLHKKKSEVIREAIDFYARSVEERKKSRIQHAIQKVKEADKKIYTETEESLPDGL